MTDSSLLKVTGQGSIKKTPDQDLVAMHTIEELRVKDKEMIKADKKRTHNQINKIKNGLDSFSQTWNIGNLTNAAHRIKICLTDNHVLDLSKIETENLFKIANSISNLIKNDHDLDRINVAQFTLTTIYKQLLLLTNKREIHTEETEQ